MVCFINFEGLLDPRQLLRMPLALEGVLPLKEGFFVISLLLSGRGKERPYEGFLVK